jgi:hypothetical protein
MQDRPGSADNPGMLFDLTQLAVAAVMSVAWVRRARQLG